MGENTLPLLSLAEVQDRLLQIAQLTERERSLVARIVPLFDEQQGRQEGMAGQCTGMRPTYDGDGGPCDGRFADHKLCAWCLEHLAPISRELARVRRLRGAVKARLVLEGKRLLQAEVRCSNG